MGSGRRRARTETPSVAKSDLTISALPRVELWSTAWRVGCLLFLTYAVFAAVTHFDFVNWDDPRDVTENAQVLRGLSFETFRWALTSTHEPYWQPLTSISHLIDISLFGLNAGAHHAVNLFLHLCNTFLVFVLFLRMTGKRGASLFVAAVFGVHPLHVESVAWITERNDVLSTFFMLLSVQAYVTFCRSGSRIFYGLLVALFGLALMAKPMVVTLPALLLVLDFWPLNRRPSVVEKLPLFAMSVAAALFAFVIQNNVGAVAGLSVLPVGARVSNALVSYASYLGMTVWPTHLAAFYPLRDWTSLSVLSSVAILTAITALAIRYRRRAPFLLGGWMWFLVALAPTIGLVQSGDQARADRFTYVALIGLTAALAWLVVERVTLPRRFTGLLAGSIVATFAILSWHQVQIWANSETLWRHTLKVTGDNFRGNEKLADALRDQGRFADARHHYTEALRLAPKDSPRYEAIIRNDLGLIAAADGARADAISQFTAAARLNPSFAEPLGNLGNELAKAGQLANAIQCFRSALVLKPDFWEARYNLSIVLVQSGKLADAKFELERLLAGQPGFTAARDLLAKLKAAGG